MSDKGVQTRRRGAFWNATEIIQRVLVLHVLVLVACAPTVIGLPFLPPDISNIPLFALLLLPVGPAVSAAVFAWQQLSRSQENSISHYFFRGYRLNWRDGLVMWGIGLVFLSILASNIAHANAVAGGSFLLAVWLVLAALISFLTLNALVISALFSFRWRDVARLSAFQLGSSWRTTVGFIAILIMVVGLMILAGEWLIFFIAGPVTWFIWMQARPMIHKVQEGFTH